jgi:hypothetical protein
MPINYYIGETLPPTYIESKHCERLGIPAYCAQAVA